MNCHFTLDKICQFLFIQLPFVMNLTLSNSIGLGLVAPDLIFDVGIGNKGAQGLSARGYVEVYSQKGVVKSTSASLPGFLQPAKQRAFLRRGLLERLQAGRLERFQFSKGPYD